MHFKHGDIIRLPETREVLFEKYSKFNKAAAIFDEIIGGCRIVFHKQYYYFLKDNEQMFEIYVFDMYGQPANFYCHQDLIWDAFLYDLDLSYNELQCLIKNQMKKIKPDLKVIALYLSAGRIFSNKKLLKLE